MGKAWPRNRSRSSTNPTHPSSTRGRKSQTRTLGQRDVPVRRTATKGCPFVPPKYTDRSVIIEVDRLLSTPYFEAASPVHRTRRPCFDVEDLGCAATGEPRLAATT